MSLKVVSAAVFWLSFLLINTCFAENMDIKEGLWEITTKTEMKGMPFSMPDSKHTQCITKDEFIPKPAESAGNCKMIKTNMDGNTGEWVMECTDNKIKIRSSGKLRYSGDTFEGTTTTVIDDPDSGKMEMNQQLSGKRIGQCK